MCKLTLCWVFTLLTFAYASKNNCELEELQRCYTASPSALFNSTDVYYAVTRQELDKNCVELRAFTNCIETYTRQCVDSHTQIAIRRTYTDITDTILSLCTPGPYQNEYLRHANCVKSIRFEYEECNKKHEINLASISEREKTEQQTWSDDSVSLDEQFRTICCSFQEYLLCSEQTVQRSCGYEAALFIRSIQKKMSSYMIQAFCDQYDEEVCGLGGKESQSNFSSLVIGFIMVANLFGVAQKIVVFGGLTYIQSLEDFIF